MPMRVSIVGRALAAITVMAIAAGLDVTAPSAAQDATQVRPNQAASIRSSEKKLRIGVYDPYGTFKSAQGIEIEHIYVPWQNVDLTSLITADLYVRERGRELLITIEPWSWSQRRRDSAETLRSGIVAGRYNASIDALCRSIGNLNSAVTIRWGHEMDLGNRRYPWSDWKPEEYVAGYRYFVDRCRKHAPKAAFLWSPRGEPRLQAYYPGDRYVDAIGLSIFGLQAYDLEAHGGERSLIELLAPSYDLVKDYNKPVLIAEFGCSGDAAYVKRCSDFSTETLSRFPQLAGVIYYSEIDTGAWPTSYGRPDWRVTPQSVLSQHRP